MKTFVLAAALGAASLHFTHANASLAIDPGSHLLSVQEIRAQSLQSYALSRSAYNEFRGEYLLENGASLRLSRHGRQFFAEVAGQARLEVRAISPNTFAAIAGGTTLVFQQHANGLVSRVLLIRPATS